MQASDSSTGATGPATLASRHESRRDLSRIQRRNDYVSSFLTLFTCRAKSRQSRAAVSLPGKRVPVPAPAQASYSTDAGRQISGNRTTRVPRELWEKIWIVMPLQSVHSGREREGRRIQGIQHLASRAAAAGLGIIACPSEGPATLLNHKLRQRSWKEEAIFARRVE